MGIISQGTFGWKGCQKALPDRLKSSVAAEAGAHVRTSKSKPDSEGYERRNWRLTRVLLERLRELSAFAFQRTSSTSLIQPCHGNAFELRITEEVVAAMRAREDSFND
jgi:hypothetical protein